MKSTQQKTPNMRHLNFLDLFFSFSVAMFFFKVASSFSLAAVSLLDEEVEGVVFEVGFAEVEGAFLVDDAGT